MQMRSNRSADDWKPAPEGSQEGMEVNLREPDLAVVLKLDPYAPRAARHNVADVDHPSPDLRDAVMLLCSELVTEAVERAPGGEVELRVWMPREVVRVEVWGMPAAIHQPPRIQPAYGWMLLDQIADRWEVERNDESACIWFEIDRQAAAVPMAAAR